MSQGNTDKATIFTFPDEFEKNEIIELAKAAGYDVVGVMTRRTS